MRDLFRAEALRFRSWTLAYAFIHLIVLGFLARMVDLAQQPARVYQVVGAVYVLTGLLLGLYQMGGYRRPNAWLNLLHRPLPQWRIALALLGAGTLLLTVAVWLPLLTIAGWQEALTTRVIDARHLWLCVSALLITLVGYLIGCYTMLANKRYGFGALVFLLLLGLGNAAGMGAIAVQLLCLAWLLAMVLFAFKPDLSTLPSSALGGIAVALPGVVATAVPLQLAMWFSLLLAGMGVETAWIASGTHPNNLSVNPPDSVKAANFADGRDLMVMGLRNSNDPDAPLWREQAAISEVFDLGPNAARLPLRNELTNIAPMEFDDAERGIRWVFSHDSMRFEGYHLADFRSAGLLGVDGTGAFASPPLPGPQNSLLTPTMLYEYDNEQNLILPRVRLPDGDVLTGAGQVGENLAVLSDRALYFYDGRELVNGDALLAPRQRLPLPGKTGNLMRIAIMELVDGYLVSFLFTTHQHNAEGRPAYQVTQRIDEQGVVTTVARREPDVSYGPAWRFQNWYVSPALYWFKNQALDLFSGYTPVEDDREVAPPPRSMMVLAGVLMALSLLAALWRTGRIDISPAARLAWILACGVLSVPALMSLWLLYPPRERAVENAASQAQPA